MEVSEPEVRAFVTRLKLIQSTGKVVAWTFVAGLFWWGYMHPHVPLSKVYLAAFFVVCLAILLAKRWLGRCPRCGDYVFSTGAWCPACGKRALEPGSFVSAPHCRACDRRLTKRGRYGTVRTYPVCSCSHCGLRLDPDGL